MTVRGKISRDEWPKILERFRQGEPLAQIARSYECTAPAIRYIVRRIFDGDRRAEASAVAQPAAAVLRPEAVASLSHAPQRVGARSVLPRVVTTGASSGNEIWGRVNNDIATFLTALDDLLSSESDTNYENLLSAADRLLLASAHTRLELERTLAARRMNRPRKRSST